MVGGAVGTAILGRLSRRRSTPDRSVAGHVELIAASCTTGWDDTEHGNLWLASDGLARIPLGWGITVAHTFQGVDPAVWWTATISRHDLAQALQNSPRALWIATAEIDAAWMHRGILVDRLRLRMKDATQHKLLWVRNKAGTGRLEGALRTWLGDRLNLD